MPDFPEDTEDYGCVPVSAQGQLTIPKAAREALGISSGDRVYLFASPQKKRAWIVVSDRPGHEIASFVSGAT